jgi:hypothetical protein
MLHGMDPGMSLISIILDGPAREGGRLNHHVLNAGKAKSCSLVRSCGRRTSRGGLLSGKMKAGIALGLLLGMVYSGSFVPMCLNGCIVDVGGGGVRRAPFEASGRPQVHAKSAVQA